MWWVAKQHLTFKFTFTRLLVNGLDMVLNFGGCSEQKLKLPPTSFLLLTSSLAVQFHTCSLPIWVCLQFLTYFYRFLVPLYYRKFKFTRKWMFGLFLHFNHCFSYSYSPLLYCSEGSNRWKVVIWMKIHRLEGLN